MMLRLIRKNQHRQPDYIPADSGQGVEKPSGRSGTPGSFVRIETISSEQKAPEVLNRNLPAGHFRGIH
jgi:hypothetical protein